MVRFASSRLIFGSGSKASDKSEEAMTNQIAIPEFLLPASEVSDGASKSSSGNAALLFTARQAAANREAKG